MRVGSEKLAVRMAHLPRPVWSQQWNLKTIHQKPTEICVKGEGGECKGLSFIKFASMAVRDHVVETM